MKIDAEYIKLLAEKLARDEEFERDKLDFKRQWYDFSRDRKRATEDFCNDVAAIANTPGLDGYIMIGLDDKNDKGKLLNSPFSKSGLNDPVQLRSILVRGVEPAPNYELNKIDVDDEGTSKTISIIWIPPSVDKPHVVRNYRDRVHLIPIRKGTSTNPASRNDIEFMYYDRKNIESEYRVEFLIIPRQLTVNQHPKGGDTHLTISIFLYIQNTGRRPIGINRASLVLENAQPPLILADELRRWIGIDWTHLQPGKPSTPGSFPYRPIIIASNSLEELKIIFRSEDLSLNKTSKGSCQEVCKFGSGGGPSLLV